MFTGTRTSPTGWGFQRSNAPSSLGFTEWLRSQTMPPLPHPNRHLQIPASKTSAGGTAGDCYLLASPGPHAAGRAGIQVTSC